MSENTINQNNYGLVDNETSHRNIEVAFSKDMSPISKSTVRQTKESDVKPGLDFQILETLASVATTSDPTSLLIQQQQQQHQPTYPVGLPHSDKHELVDALNRGDLTLMEIPPKNPPTILDSRPSHCGFNLESSEANKMVKKRKRKNMLQKLKTEKCGPENRSKIGKKKTGSKKKKMKLVGISPEMSTSRMPSASAILDTPPREGMDKEIELIRNFKCECKYGGEGESCIRQFNNSAVLQLRYSMSDVTSYEKDLLLLGKLSCTINVSRLTNCTRRREQKERQQQRILYYVENHRVCRATFKFMHKISQNKLTALIKWYKDHGLTPRKKRIGGKKISKDVTDRKLPKKKPSPPESPIAMPKTDVTAQQQQTQQKQQQQKRQKQVPPQQHLQQPPQLQAPPVIQQVSQPQRVAISQTQQPTSQPHQHQQQHVQQVQQVQHVQHAFLQQSLMRQTGPQQMAAMQVHQQHPSQQYIPPQFHHHGQPMQYHHLLTPQQQAYSMPQPNYMQ
ncbi:uncharacterized protein [Antedon mediterranea]|uniref:uncharacterized protein n=1 Tax=Antedon mediterranea TaxID=105859 RepID=UPI003AF92C9B